MTGNKAPSPEPDEDKSRWSAGAKGYFFACLYCVGATIAGRLLHGTLAEANLVLVYLLAVVLVTVHFGRGPGILASFLAVLAFDLFMVLPYHSLDRL